MGLFSRRRAAPKPSPEKKATLPPASSPARSVVSSRSVPLKVSSSSRLAREQLPAEASPEQLQSIDGAASAVSGEPMTLESKTPPEPVPVPVPVCSASSSQAESDTYLMSSESKTARVMANGGASGLYASGSSKALVCPSVEPSTFSTDDLILTKKFFDYPRVTIDSKKKLYKQQLADVEAERKARRLEMCETRSLLELKFDALRGQDPSAQIDIVREEIERIQQQVESKRNLLEETKKERYRKLEMLKDETNKMLSRKFSISLDDENQKHSELLCRIKENNEKEKSKITEQHKKQLEQLTENLDFSNQLIALKDDARFLEAVLDDIQTRTHVIQDVLNVVKPH